MKCQLTHFSCETWLKLHVMWQHGMHIPVRVCTREHVHVWSMSLIKEQNRKMVWTNADTVQLIYWAIFWRIIQNTWYLSAIQCDGRPVTEANAHCREWQFWIYTFARKYHLPYELVENYHAKSYFKNFRCSKEALQLGSRRRGSKSDHKAHSIRWLHWV